MHYSILAVPISIFLFASRPIQASETQPQTAGPVGDPGAQKTASAFFDFTHPQWASLPANLKVLFKILQNDIDLVLSGKKPATIKSKIVEFDGGTQIFECNDYNITLWKEHLTINGSPFLKTGISITLNEKYNPEYKNRPIVDNTRLEPLPRPTAP